MILVGYPISTEYPSGGLDKNIFRIRIIAYLPIVGGYLMKIAILLSRTYNNST